ncbi:MAG: family 43 glycosylhydrolase [Adhaeribacter sp.]
MKKVFVLMNALALLACSCKAPKSTDQPAGTATTNTAQPAATYQNPVLAGDYADPSVIRVGSDYYATATSSEWAPLFPLLHSKNLVDWETVGHVFPEKGPAWADSRYWAPEISYEKGKYYIYYTAKKKGGNLCVGVASATSPTGPYTDHGPLVCQEMGSIDGFPIRDEKGDLYLIWKEDGNSRKLPTPLWGQRMNEERTALLGEKFELFRNDPGTWEGGLVEGPALMRRGDYFYMFYAGDKCCGRTCTYGVGVARAKNLRGPWEKFSGNPIMKQNDTWKCAGHGSVVTDEKGRDFFLYHAYTTDTFVYTGREGLLDEITWAADGWPRFAASAPSASAPTPYGQNAPDQLDVKEEFDQPRLASSWQWSVTEAAPFTLEAANKGRLKLKASPELAGSMLGQRTKTGDYTAVTALDRRSLGAGIQAGLSALGDPANAMGIALKDQEIVLWKVERKNLQVLDRMPAPGQNLIQFKLSTQAGNQMVFSWSADGKTWTNMNRGQALSGDFLPPWDRGVRVGLSAQGPASGSASFDWFTLTHKN